MSLANIQHLVLRLTIDPAFADQFRSDPKSVQAALGLNDQEIEWAQQIPPKQIEEFQATVCAKRSRRAESVYARTHQLVPLKRRMEYFREFARQHVMRYNQWAEKALDYLNFVEGNVQDSTDRQDTVLREVVQFEKWLYLFSQEEFAERAGTGYATAANVRVQAFPFPAEPLIADPITPANINLLIEGYGTTTGYVLAQKIGTQVDLYEIDECYYNLIRLSDEPCSLAELTKRAETVAKELGLQKQPEEMITELQEFGILIQLGEAN